MTRAEIRTEIADQLGLLASDGTTILEGKVTSDGIDRTINRYLQQKIGPYLTNKYPQDFKSKTLPFQTYTKSFVVSAVTDTTLDITTTDMPSGVAGFYLQNATDGEKIKIASWTDSSTVELESEPEEDWTGDTIYLLGNEFALAGADIADLVEVSRIKIRYSTADEYVYTKLVRETDALEDGSEMYHKASPKHYLTSLTVSGVKKRAIGILPHPEAYNGDFVIEYTAVFPKMTDDNDVPLLSEYGMGDALIEGVTSWGWAMLKDTENEMKAKKRYEEAVMALARNYRPRTRGQKMFVRPSKRNSAIRAGLI